MFGVEYQESVSPPLPLLHVTTTIVAAASHCCCSFCRCCKSALPFLLLHAIAAAIFAAAARGCYSCCCCMSPLLLFLPLLHIATTIVAVDIAPRASTHSGFLSLYLQPTYYVTTSGCKTGSSSVDTSTPIIIFLLRGSRALVFLGTQTQNPLHP